MKTTELVEEFLKKNGFFYEVDPDNGNITFKFEMKDFLLVNTNDDEEYFQLIMPQIYDVSEENREIAIEAANTVNLNTKIAKACILEDGVWLFFESALDYSPEIDIIMKRALRTLDYAAHQFYKALN